MPKTIKELKKIKKFYQDQNDWTSANQLAVAIDTVKNYYDGQKRNWKSLLNLLTNEEIIIDNGTIEQTIVIELDSNNYFELDLSGFLDCRDATSSEHENLSCKTKLDVMVRFSHFSLNGIDQEWTAEQKESVHDILKAKFESEYDYFELNY